MDCCTDCAEMHSACEFSNGKTSQINQPLYVYNKDNSILYSNSYYNKSIENMTEQERTLAYIRSFPPCNYTWPFTYIINLPKEVTKKSNMITQLTWMQNSNYEFVEAVNGETTESKLYHEYLQKFQSKEYLQHIPKPKLHYNNSRQHITKGSLGLLMSVFKVLNHFVNRPELNHIVLFEDDIYTLKEIQYYFFLHEEVLMGKDLVYLGCHHERQKIYKQVNDKDVFIDVKQYPYLIYGTYSIIISKQLAKFILSFGLEEIVKLNLSWDLFLNYIREKYEHTYYLYFKELFIPDVCKDGINEIRDKSFYTERDMKVENYLT